MTNIPLGRAAWRRMLAHEPEIYVVNRYFEAAPTNQVDNVSLLRRPALARRTIAGDGPVRRVYQQDGVFDNDMFVISNHALYRVHKYSDGMTPDTVTFIPGYVNGTDTPYMTAAYVTGGTQYLFVSDGFTLQWTNGVSLLAQVLLPDDVSPTSIDYIKGYVIVTVGEPFSQRFYWIQPGTVVVDPLDFAEAESSLDPTLNVTTISDQFWLFGTDTTEPWYVTGDPAAPMAPIQGRPYNRGIWEGTVVKVNDSVILVGKDGRVYDVAAGPDPISYPGIEERIRAAMVAQAEM